MANVQRLYDKVIEGQVAVSFRDLQRLLVALGFRLGRISGSHHIYLHADVSRPINIQRGSMQNHIKYASFGI
jgi:predicted RNA binding protein YcfA (HicA-like mRNA interferase family)